MRNMHSELNIETTEELTIMDISDLYSTQCTVSGSTAASASNVSPKTVMPFPRSYFLRCLSRLQSGGNNYAVRVFYISDS
jgi:hypothetical protein